MSRDLILVALSLMTWGLGEGMFLYFEPLYMQQLGASPVMIGGILGGVGIAMTLSYLPAGYISDRLGRRPLLRLAWLLGVSATWIMALSRTLPVFVLGIILYGATAYVVVPLNSYITAARGKWSVGRALTIISASFSLGAILGPLIGGWIGERVGLQRTFLVAAIIFIFSTLLIFLIRTQPVEAPHPDPSGRGVRGLLLNARYSRFLIIVFIVMFCMYLPQPLSQNFLQNQRSLNLAQIGQLISARYLGVVVLNLTLGQINAQAGFLLAQIGMGLFTLLIWKGTGMPWYALGYFLLGGYQTARSLATAQGRSLIHHANMGLGYGMIETMASMAIILAPPLAGYLYSLNPVLIYPVSLVLIGIAIAVTLVFSPIKVEEMD
jgi:predicted MFS family arabinose efflux permease